MRRAETTGSSDEDGSGSAGEGASANRKATIRDVAARAGVSVATVSRVITGNYPVAAPTRSRVMRAVRELDYVVNAHARALAGNGSKIIAVLLSDITSPFFNRVVHGVEQQATAEDRLCMICTTQGDPEREVRIVETLREQNVDAVVLVGGIVDSPEYRERMGRLARLLDGSGSRLVLCGRPPPGAGLPVTVVEYENSGGAFAATSHLLSQGHRRIVFVGGRAGNTTTEARVEGFRRALDAYRLPSDDPHLVTASGHGRQAGYDAVRRRLARVGGEPDFTAIVAWNDVVAVGALAALREAGVDVPGRVSVVGYNDDQIAMDTVPPLTTVSIPHFELGRTAIRLALHRNDPSAPPAQHVTLGTHIVVRGSVRPLIHH